MMGAESRAEAETTFEPDIIDLRFQGESGVIAGFLLRTDDELGLIETGPTTTLESLLAALEPFGGLEKLSAVAVTHVHLDHAGAVGRLLGLAPHVRCYVHALGATHLVDPSRLLRSASRIYGDQMGPLWGQVTPAPEDRILVVEDGDTLTLGGRDLEVLHTPGHAVHHIALFDRGSSAVYTGDLAGIRLPAMNQVRPAAPPPDLDPETWRASIERVRRLEPRTLHLTHYGSFAGDVNGHLDGVLTRLDAWIDVVRRARQSGMERDAIVAAMRLEGDGEIRAEGGDDVTIRRYDLATPYYMTVDGIIRYLERGSG